MIISNNQVQNILKIYRQELNTGKVDRSSQVKGKVGAKDELAISGESRIKNRAFQAAKQTEDIRQDTVDKLKEEIATGTYTRSDDEVAEKMIARAIVDRLI